MRVDCFQDYESAVLLRADDPLAAGSSIADSGFAVANSRWASMAFAFSATPGLEWWLHAGIVAQPARRRPSQGSRIMSRSTDRILGSHGGNLPRPPDMGESLVTADHHRDEIAQRLPLNAMADGAAIATQRLKNR